MTLYKNARLRGCTELKDIFVKDGRIEKIADSGTIAPENAEKIELDGRLVCEPYCDPHIHLDYVFTSSSFEENSTGTLFDGIASWSDSKKGLCGYTDSCISAGGNVLLQGRRGTG